MSALQSLLVFVGIPLLVGIVVAVLVSAGSWTRSGRTNADFDTGPVLITSDPAAPDPSRLPRESRRNEPAPAGGGISARW